jgi:hypothetical protein
VHTSKSRCGVPGVAELEAPPGEGARYSPLPTERAGAAEDALALMEVDAHVQAPRLLAIACRTGSIGSVRNEGAREPCHQLPPVSFHWSVISKSSASAARLVNSICAPVMRLRGSLAKSMHRSAAGCAGGTTSSLTDLRLDMLSTTKRVVTREGAGPDPSARGRDRARSSGPVWFRVERPVHAPQVNREVVDEVRELEIDIVALRPPGPIQS